MKRHLLLAIAIVCLLAGIFGAGADGLAAEGKATKYVRFQVGNTIAYGIVEGESIRQIEGDRQGGP